MNNSIIHDFLAKTGLEDYRMGQNTKTIAVD